MKREDNIKAKFRCIGCGYSQYYVMFRRKSLRICLRLLHIMECTLHTPREVVCLSRGTKSLDPISPCSLIQEIIRKGRRNMFFVLVHKLR
jgi:hypothetical protein